MRINVKLLFLTISIITLVSVSSAFIYHTLTKKLLLSQQSKALVNSANDFIFTFEEFVGKTDEEFNDKYKTWNSFDIENSDIDFIIRIKEDSLIQKIKLKRKNNSNIYTNVTTLSQLTELNSNLILRKSKVDSELICYGRILTPEIVEKLSEKIRAEVAFVESGVVAQYTHKKENENFLPNLSKAARELQSKNNFELINQELESVDFFATHFTPKNSEILNPHLDFLIFSISKEASEFRDTMNLVTALIVVAGMLLTIIFSFLFTTKFRKQLSYINEGVLAIAAGNLSKRVKIISKDEIGNLGNAFNEMLSEIENRDKIEKEYAEFLSLINKNPSLEEISEVAIEKIINYTGADIGALYMYEEDELVPLSVYGITDKEKNLLSESSLYKRVKENKEILELHFEKNQPVVKTGLVELKLSCLYILPLVYDDEVIAVIELASVNENSKNTREYFERIKEQLSIGLANARSLNKLEKLVEELKRLNEVYHKQNIQITEQNEELLELHRKLKKGSEELEIQRAKAVESAKLKSQFLANMSHELRTPQNSILGLTELILKDKTTTPKTKERLNVVLRNGKKLLNLIENILEFSKLEAGNIKIEKSEIMLTELSEEISSFVEPLFYERDVKFNLQLPVFNDYVLNTDIKKVEQIILNLVGNASKFTKEGYVQLAIEVSGSDLRIIVEDTGPGINESDKKIIFEEFRQADANINRKYSGTGLGLTICKRYSNLLGGTIEVENSKNRGAKFIVSLPNVIKSRTVKQYVQQEQNEEPNNINAILISSGDHSTKLIKDFLSNNNITVEVFNTNNDIIETIKNGDYNLIILDILFDKQGWTLLNKLKSNNTVNNIPIVTLNMDEEANCGLGLQILEYYPQPLIKPNIYRAIEQFENLQGIKFRNVLLIMNDEKYVEIEDDMIFDELKVNQINGKVSTTKLVKKYEPDLIIIDLYDLEANPFLILNELNQDKYSKCIPTVAFIEEIAEEKEMLNLNNKIIEATLIAQNHPLEVLQIIKSRVEHINNSIFNIDDKSSKSLNNKNFTQQKTNNDGIKILVVDDDNDALFTIGEIIDSLGYEPVYASNGYECLEKLDKDIPDLGLLDIMMPQMDGFEAIKRIRNDSRFKNLNVYALTAYAMLSDKEIIEKNGFNGLFTKPINTHLIEKKLKSIFSEV
jgi:signal transduction histidine kinase/CheY-like chemotaxis protein/HAMP domain-containing protein